MNTKQTRKAMDKTVKKEYGQIPLVEDSNQNILSSRGAYYNYIIDNIYKIANNHNIDIENITPNKFSLICVFIGEYVYRKNRILIYDGIRINYYKACLAYEIYKLVCDNYNICVAVDNYCSFININEQSFYNLCKANNQDINNNIYNNGVSSSSNNNYINNNNMGRGDGVGEGVTLPAFDLAKKLYSDMKSTHERRMSGGQGVNPVSELAILNHHFNYTNAPQGQQQQEKVVHSLPRLSFGGGQNNGILPQNDDIL